MAASVRTLEQIGGRDDILENGSTRRPSNFDRGQSSGAVGSRTGAVDIEHPFQAQISKRELE